MDSEDRRWAAYIVVFLVAGLLLYAVLLLLGPWTAPNRWSGDAPGEVTSYSCNPSTGVGGPDCSSDGISAYRWDVPAGASVTGEAGVVLLGRQRPFYAVAGRLELHAADCPATVAWQLATREDPGSTPVVLTAGRLSPAAADATVPDRPFRRPARSLQLSFRRVDELPCAATVDWSAPRVDRTRDGAVDWSILGL